MVKEALFSLIKASGIESPSQIKIGTFNGLRFAFRQGTADECVLAGCGKSAFCSKTEGVHKALLSSEV